MDRLRIGVVYGGRSGEHEVSLASAAAIFSQLDPKRYDAVPVFVDKNGRWSLADAIPATMSAGEIIQNQHARARPNTAVQPSEAHFVTYPSEETVISISRDNSTMGQSVDRAVVRGLSLDIIFPIIHGPFGEDGSLQGLLELANVPFVGSGVLASALAMDKSMSKVVFAAHGLPLVPHMVVKASEWETNPETIVDKINQVFSYPVFVKPANLGSSIGVSRVTNKAELEAALSKAYSLDNTLLVEKAVIKAREIECSVLGNESPLTSVPGEVIPSGEFYDYESKYLDDRSELRIPANLSIELSNKVRDLSVKAFLALGCTGMARVDFLLDQDNETLYINEVNTLPGFTTISQYAKLWEATGLAYSALLDRLIELALARHDRKNRIETLR